MSMIRLFGERLSFISNGSVMSIGYRLGARGFTDFMVNVAPRLSLHRWQLVQEKRWDEFDKIELAMQIDPPLKAVRPGDLSGSGMGEGPDARLRLRVLGLDTGPHFPLKWDTPRTMSRHIDEWSTRAESASGSTGTDRPSTESEARENMTDIYSRLGVTPVINGIGNKTTLGGSTPSPRAKQAMEEADYYYCSMPELMDRTGERVAELLGVEAAFITSGCASAILHAAAGVMAGPEKEDLGRLPDTTGMKHEFIFQRKQRYFYDRCYVVPGGTLVVVGDEESCTAREMEEAITPDTAGIGFVDKIAGD